MSHAPSSARDNGMRITCSLVLGWMVIVSVFALLAWNRLNLSADTAYPWINTHHLHTPQWDVRALPARWDSEWYLDIARSGYQFNTPDQLQNVVFFPTYPLLIRLVSTLLFGNAIVAGWAISLAALMGACLLFHELIRTFHKKQDPTETVLLLLTFPTAIFFLGIYTESLFLFLSIGALLFARKNQFWIAIAFGMVAALTRVTGALLLIPILWEVLLAFRAKKIQLPAVLGTALIPIAGAAFFAFHWLKTGDLFHFFKVQAAWGRTFSFNEMHLLTQTPPALVNLFLDIGFVLLGIFLTIRVATHVRKSYAAYCAASILVPLSTGTLMSIGRYLLVLFPLFLAVSTFSARTRRLWLLASTLLLALYTLLYAHSYWAG